MGRPSSPGRPATSRANGRGPVRGRSLLAEAAAEPVGAWRAWRRLRGREGSRADSESPGRERGRSERGAPGSAAHRIRSRGERRPFVGRPEGDRSASALVSLRPRGQCLDRQPPRQGWCRSTRTTAASCCCRSGRKACSIRRTAPRRASRSTPMPRRSTCRRASSSIGQNGDVYVSDGEGAGGNRRIAVMDKHRQVPAPVAARRHERRALHDDREGRARLRLQPAPDRQIQVYDKMGNLKKTIDVPWTPVRRRRTAS